MATIGTLGDIVFEVSHNKVNTFDNMAWNSSVRYTMHDRHLQESLYEFSGLNSDSITFTMYFSVFLGINPIDEITKLLKAEREGRVMTLTIGLKAYGKNKWSITGTNKELEIFDKDGNLLKARVSVTLCHYAGK